jgi:hypothetical protein
MDLKPLMDPSVIGIAVLVILVVAVLASLYVWRRRTRVAALRQLFAPEYEREHGSERRAEAQLVDREKRVDLLKVRDLDPTSGSAVSLRR